MLWVVLSFVALGQQVMGQLPQVTTSQGIIKGKALKSRDGKDFFSFTKIPYAKPPVGERRFMISEKADNWHGVLDATQSIPSCYQDGRASTEDCLYLNIFTPNITGKLPVIFSIHGGGFLRYSAGDFGSAEYFMDEDVVFAAPNYRLGALGFLSLEDDKIPGNMGLKDQALALEWVHNEISAFGGDPNLITVIGESAGGASSNLICSVPKTNGLIKGCISQSGDSWSPWAYQKPGLAKERAMNLIRAVGCAGSEDQVKCLQGQPIELVGNITLLSNDSVSLSIVTPVVEPSSAPGALLTVFPPAAHDYPWIVGLCQDDGMLFTSEYEYNKKKQPEIDQFINDFSDTLIKKLNLENRLNEVQKIRERFFTKDVEPLRAIRNFFTEYMFMFPALKGLNKQSGPSYFYKFNYTGGPQFPFDAVYSEIGVGHAAEMPYFFKGPYKSSWGWPKKADIDLSKMLVKMWVNFARNQTPSSQETVQWSQFQGKYYLDIQNSGVTLKENTQLQEIFNFWNTMFPEPTSKSSASHSSLLVIVALCVFSVYKGLLF